MTDRHKTHWSGRHYAADHIAGPLPFLNPTTRVHPVPSPPAAKPPRHSAEEDRGETEKGTGADAAPPSSSAYAVWRSRDNRKGRHALALAAAPHTPAVLAGLGRMALRWPVWDISYDVAVVFTLGSVSNPPPPPFLPRLCTAARAE